MHLKQYPVPALYSQVRKKNGEYPPGMFQEFYVRLVHSEGDVYKRQPAGRDLIKEYVEALREEGLKVGLYFTLLRCV